MLRLIGQHLWPDAPTGGQSSIEMKSPVCASLGLLVASKVVIIQVPFIFKDIIDNLGAGQHTAQLGDGAAMVIQAASSDPTLSVPFALVVGYGVARTTATAFQELRSAIFASVAQNAIRKVSGDVFMHLLQRELQFHLDRKIGTLGRIIDRGGRSINYALTSMLFSIVPTALEIGLVAGILTMQFSTAHAVVTLATVSVYTLFTVRYSESRIPVRKAMNDAEAQANQRSIDALMNYEVVKYFGTEQHEAKRCEELTCRSPTPSPRPVCVVRRLIPLLSL
jgi:ABC-type multidrug transport system fused ATPase/permease subunit